MQHGESSVITAVPIAQSGMHIDVGKQPVCGWDAHGRTLPT
jgi:hypothetical protein